MTASGERHMSLRSFGGYLRSMSPVDHPIPGSPRVVLFFDPIGGRVGIRGPAGAQRLPAELENISVRRLHLDGRDRVEVAITDQRLFVDGYPLLCGIADRVQIDGMSMAKALQTSLRQLGHLIAGAASLSQEAETGLFGELIFLEGLAAQLGPTPAVASWRGGLREEHDFGFADLDVEVKTTASESRAHWISSFEQLDPTGSRPLWLVSLQITSAGDGGSTVLDLIVRLRGACVGTEAEVAFESGLRGYGWRERFAPNATRRWRLRSPATAHLVDDGFPRLTRKMLQAAGADMGRVLEGQYKIDLGSLAPGTPPPPLGEALRRIQELV